MRPELATVLLRVAAPASLPVGLFVSGAFSAVVTRSQSSLFVTAIAWGLIALYQSYTTEFRFNLRDGQTRTRKLCWITGLVFALAQICERVAADKEGVWWTRSFLPLFTYLILRSGLHTLYHSFVTLDDRPSPVQEEARPGTLLLIITGTSAVVLSTAYTRPEVTLLGICGTSLIALTLVLLGIILGAGNERGRQSNGGTGSGNARRHLSHSAHDDEIKTAMRDTAVTVFGICFAASFMIEGHHTDPLASQANNKYWSGGWKEDRFFRNLGQDLTAVTVEIARCLFTFILVRRYNSVNVSLIALGSVLISKLYLETTVWQLWLCVIYITASALLIDDSLATPVFFSAPKRRMRVRQLTILVGGFSAVVLLVKVYQNHSPPYVAPVAVEDFAFPWEPPTELLDPVKAADTSSHPISQLIDSAQTRFDQLLNRQSKTLDAAVKEYRRRYGIPPPPRFDVWFEFAKRRNVQLIDEFDNIHHSLLPFWGLEPSVIRKRVAEALGFDGNFLIGLCIRNGEVTHIKDGADWQQEATTGMMKSFVQYLPDMDLAFNIHDEPRVVIPHDLLSRLVDIAKSRNMPAANRHREPTNSFSPRPTDLNEGTHFAEVKVTRFNVFAHQPTWTHSRLSCPPDSPARVVDDSPRDNITSYAYSNLGFVYNHTAFSDICHSPSLRSTFGFFDRPNAFNIVQDLFPIFSQSKINSFQDILYPSPWYWAGKVEYVEDRDMSWSSKESSLYWRGSTTGGFSRKGGWRRQHRQRVVRRLNAPDTALILHNNGTDALPNWQAQDVQRRDFADIVDVKFSHVGQCDPDDCDAQKEFFQVTDRVDQQDAWKYQYLLDMDGNAFSGRFYAFLRSNSLVFKMSLFAEWHAEWLKPWAHYIPVSLIGDEWLEAVRYFAAEKLGKKQGPLMATAGQEWAKKALRNEDIEVWFFRLLLEYGRLVDDNRERIGYGDF